MSSSPSFCFACGRERLFIGGTLGRRNIAEAIHLFSHIDPTFEELKCGAKGEPRGKTPVSVHEIIGTTTYGDMFASVCTNMQELSFTQGQILAFVEKNSLWLLDSSFTTIFPLKVRDSFFAVQIRSPHSNADLEICRHELSTAIAWVHGVRRRAVFPESSITNRAILT